jgi:hypothetical protein
MSATKCPNCGKFTFKKVASPRTTGFFMILAGLLGPSLVAGGAEYHGGQADMGMLGLIGVGVALLGLLVIILSFFNKPTTVTYSCSDCNYRNDYSIDR